MITQTHIFDDAREHLEKMKAHEHCCGTPQVRGLLAEGERLRTALLTVMGNMEGMPGERASAIRIYINQQLNP